MDQKTLVLVCLCSIITPFPVTVFQIHLRVLMDLLTCSFISLRGNEAPWEAEVSMGYLDSRVQR